MDINALRNKRRDFFSEKSKLSQSKTAFYISVDIISWTIHIRPYQDDEK